MIHRVHSLCLLLLVALSAVAGDNVLPSWAIGGFTRPEGKNPMVSPIADNLFLCPMKNVQVKWECADTFNPAAVVKDGKVCILYRAEDDPSAGIGKRTSRIGYVESEDGVTIDYRSPSPVMYPDNSAMSTKYEWPGGTEDPRVVEAEVDGKSLYVMMHTSWNRSMARLSVATSPDLKTWTHHGPCFRTAYNGKFANLACKSGSLVTTIKDGRLQAVKINVGGEQKYFMYFGEHWICGATSDDLITWTPLVDSDGELNYLVKPRKGYFDSQLTECGPPAVLTEDGIVLIYNGKNASGSSGDGCYAANTYTAGQLLFNSSNPTQILDRLDRPFLRPMDDFEKSGQFAAGTVFTEGLVYHNDKWFLYYGCADSFVGVAVCDSKTAVREGDPIVSASIPKGVINQQTSLSMGKMRCFVNSFSGQAASGEGADNMLLSYVYPGRKWCDTSTQNPWLVLEFTGIYAVNRLVFRDVANRESNCGNVPEYWVYGRKTDTEGWMLLAHEDNVADLGEKDITFPETEVRYMKLVFTRGIRPSGVADNAIRLYGCDVYGRFVSELSRTDGIVSVGKTILAAYDTPNPVCCAMNLLTGAPSTDRFWQFSMPEPTTNPNRYVIIDLEHQYDLTRLLFWDAKSFDSNATNMNAYQLFISAEKPDLSLITKTGDENTCWTLAAEKKGVGSMNKKTVALSPTVRGRYVKLVFPRTTASMNKVSSPKLYAFHVYGTLAPDMDDAVTSPETVPQFDETVYTLSGIPLKQQHLFPDLYIKGGKKVLVR